MHTRLFAAVLAAGLALSATAALASQAITLDKVDLLSSPFANSKALGSVEQGSKVGVLWCGTDIAFCLVRYHAKSGFVALSEIDMIEATVAADGDAGAGGSNGGSSNGLIGPHVVIGGGVGFPLPQPLPKH
jgi:hypothetical protein